MNAVLVSTLNFLVTLAVSVNRAGSRFSESETQKAVRLRRSFLVFGAHCRILRSDVTLSQGAKKTARIDGDGG